MPCKKRDVDGCAPWMKKRWSLYNWGGRKRKNPYGIYTTRIVFNVKCMEQYNLDI